MNRIPFGQETKLEILTATCPGCNGKRGCYHEIGCPLESCPECGGRLLKCSCMALSLVDEMKLFSAVAKTMTRDQVLAMADKSSTALGSNYEEMGAYTWIIHNAPPVMQQEMEEMALEILGAEKHGDLFRVPLDKAAEVLGMSQEEAAPIMKELETECLYPGWYHAAASSEQ